MAELGTYAEKILSGVPQQSIPAESVNGSGVEAAHDFEAFTLAKVEFGKTQQCRFSGVGRTSIGAAVPPNQTGPDLVHRVGVGQRSTGDLSANEQLDHDKATQEFSRSWIGAETPQIREGLNHLVDLRIAKGWNGAVFDIGCVEAVVESFKNDLLAVGGCHGDHFGAAIAGGVGEVAKRVVLVFGYSVRTIDDEHTLRCAQLGEDLRERVPQCILEVDGELRNVA